MISFPRAKINIGLRVIRKRNDGFHDIETLFYPVPLCDALEFVVQPGNPVADELTTTGIDINTRPENNLVLMALKRMREKHSVPFLKIHLHKAIPSGAGLGGGSSDAACMLVALNKGFRFELSDESLRDIALGIGSDCPFFINPLPSLATGRGEKLIPLPPFLEGLHIVLINPGIRISTRDAYMNTHPVRRKERLENIINDDITNWKKYLKNDFEDYVFKVYPQIGEIKKSLYRSGAIYSSLSGSGSTVYGIFEEKPFISPNLKKDLIWKGRL
ncbi:MAG: 4-(cytidine 5'-diphospho)-2-C-methyl-D-erythritol kinase [Bacteroidales bacterium]|nr:4-(cytidine 5'-diphospho)-2-C-methyl-D-erythritol kinase [Bacteroidales bacterium]